MKLLARIVLGFMACLLLAAQGVAATPKVDSILNVPKEEFKVSSNNPNQFYYIKPGVDLRQYQSVMVAPLVILNQGEGNDWNVLVTDSENAPKFFQDHLTAALHKQGIQVVSEPGPGVLRLQIAVTHARQDRPGFSATDVFPVKMVFNLARFAVGKSPFVVKLSTTAELSDSVSGDLLAGGLGLREDSKSGEQPMSQDELQAFLARWSDQVALYMAKAFQPPVVSAK